MRFYKILQNRFFFRNFSRYRIIDMINNFDLNTLKAHEVLCVSDDKVYVVASGCLIIKNHDIN